MTPSCRRTSTGRLRSWNAAAERLFGYSADEVVGRPITLVPRDRREEERGFLARIRAGERIDRFETLRRRKTAVGGGILVGVTPSRMAVAGSSARRQSSATSRSRGGAQERQELLLHEMNA